jgi:hypothetical protein
MAQGERVAAETAEWRGSGMKGAGLLLFLLIATARPAAAQPPTAEPPSASNWRLASTSQNIVTFVDAASIERKAEGVRFWSWSILREPSPDGTRYDNNKTLVDAACREKSYTNLGTIFYRGTQTTNRYGEEPQIRYATPGSAMGALIGLVCNPEALGEVAGDPFAEARRLFEAGVDATALPTPAVDWRRAGVATDHVVFVDAASLDRSGDEVRFWLWMIYPSSSTDGSPYDNLKSLIVASCSDKSFASRSTTVYLGHRPMKIFAADPAPESNVMDRVVEAACHPETLGETSADPFSAAPELLGNGGKG